MTLSVVKLRFGVVVIRLVDQPPSSAGTGIEGTGAQRRPSAWIVPVGLFGLQTINQRGPLVIFSRSWAYVACWFSGTFHDRRRYYTAAVRPDRLEGRIGP